MLLVSNVPVPSETSLSIGWQCFNDSLDSGWVQSTGWMARIFLEGVTPVNPEDPWGYQANQALEEHK